MRNISFHKNLFNFVGCENHIGQVLFTSHLGVAALFEKELKYNSIQCRRSFSRS